MIGKEAISSPAWIIRVGVDLNAVIGRRELIHLIPDATLHSVPRTPRHCSRVIVWQDRIVPVYEFDSRLGDQNAQRKLVAIVGFHEQPRQLPAYGALLLIEPPVGINVTDDAAIPRPPDANAWECLAQVWIRLGGKPTAILDIRRMFASTNF